MSSDVPPIYERDGQLLPTILAKLFQLLDIPIDVEKHIGVVSVMSKEMVEQCNEVLLQSARFRAETAAVHAYSHERLLPFESILSKKVRRNILQIDIFAPLVEHLPYRALEIRPKSFRRIFDPAVADEALGCRFDFIRVHLNCL